MLSEKYETVIDEHKVVRNKITCRPTPQVSLARYLFDHLEKEPERVLFIDAPTGQEWKRGQTKDEVVKMAKVLLSRGLVEGDRFCVFAPNTMTHIILQIAAFATNICYAGCYATYSARELEHILTILEAKALFIYKDKYDIAISVAGKIPSLKHIVILDSTEDICRKVVDGKEVMSQKYYANNSDSVAVEIPRPLTRDAKLVEAAILFSSGSTGVPKGVPRSHFNQVAFCIKMAEHWPLLGPPGGIIPVGMLMHLSGFSAMQIITVSGHTGVIDPLPDMNTTLDLLQKYKANMAVFTPTLAISVAKLPADALSKIDFSNFKYLTTASMCLADNMKRPIKKVFGVDSLTQIYGSTETGFPISGLPGDQNLDILGAPLPGTAIRIVDPETGVVVGPGKVGEAQVKSDEVFKGYVKNDKANEGVFTDDGFFKTGDAMYYDEKGHFYIVDRYKEVLKVGGKQVAPAEVEAVLLSHEAVNGAVVVGLPDELYGDVPLAFIVVKKGVQPDDDLKEQLIAHVKSQVADQKQLRGGVRFLDKLPLIGVGKIDRAALKKMAKENIKH